MIRSAACLLVAVALAAAARAELTVTNLAPGTELRYPVALLVGTAAGESISAGLAEQPPACTAPIAGGRFRVLVRLAPGDNTVVLTAGDERLELPLRYRPMTNPRLVRLVYLTGEEGAGPYPTPHPDAPQDAVERLRTGARLMQTFCAEAMNEQGYGRLTFRLEEDAQGEPVVHTIAYPEPAETMRARDPGEQWQRTNRFLARRFAEGSKILCMNAFVAYDAEKKQMRGHTALGGGNLAVFSANSLYAWPASLADVPRAFLDATRVDTAFVADDTAFRATEWAQAATGIGAWLHELGHTFGLPHSRDGRCIMARGFDHFNRSFVAVEAPRNGRDELYLFGDGETGTWDPLFACRLALHPWFQPDAPLQSPEPEPSLMVDFDADTVLVNAPAGIAVLQAIGRDERVANAPGHAGGATEARLSRAELRALVESPKGAGVLVFDRAGRSAYLDEGTVKNPAWFITRWRFSPEPAAWDPPAPPALDADAIVATLRAQPLREAAADPGSGQYSADLNALYGERGNAVAYAMREIVCAAERTVRLLAGGDDGLPVWLNGQLVIDAAGVHVIPVDDKTADVTLHAGTNELLVETQQGPGSWLFSVRLATPDGKPLGLDDAGRIAAM